MGREIRLVARPQGFPGKTSSRWRRRRFPTPAEGQVLIRNAYFSVDPVHASAHERRAFVRRAVHARRGDDGRSGREVVVSRNSRYREGEWVLHQLGWREWALSDGAALRRLDPAAAPISTALGVLGMPGFTAWYGLFVLGEPKEGDTVFVSGAAGAVGSAAGQMAQASQAAASSAARDRRRSSSGCASWGSTTPSTTTSSARTRPCASSRRTGSTCTSTTSAATIWRRPSARSNHGRIVACGSISRYNDAEPAPGPRNMFMVVTKRLRMQGYIITDHFERFGEFAREGRRWVHDGRLRLSRDDRRGHRERAATPSSACFAARTSARCSSRSARTK